VTDQDVPSARLPTYIYNDVTTEDDSTGCSSHSSYHTDANISGPNGAYIDAGQISGFDASTELAFATPDNQGDPENYFAAGSLEFYCGCAYKNVSSGYLNKINITIRLTLTGVTTPQVMYDSDGDPYCHYTGNGCTPGTTPTCKTSLFSAYSVIYLTPPCPTFASVSCLYVTMTWPNGNKDSACYAWSWAPQTTYVNCN
jgi:hypothetical protein